MSRKVFVSRDPSHSELLRSYVESWGLELIATSLISFEKQDFEVDPASFDLVFFTSPQTVRSFYSKYPSTDLPVCCIGKGTAATIPTRKKIVFTGEGSTEKVALDFRNWLPSGRKVLFPIGDRSLRRVQKELDSAQYENLVVYHTELLPRKIASADIYIFTSPSNAESFLNVNELPAEAEIIAMGKSTKNFFEKRGISAVESLNYRASGLWYTIFSSTCS